MIDYLHTSLAMSMTWRSFAHCCSSVRRLPSSVEAKPHCGLRHSWSKLTKRAASLIRRFTSSGFSSSPYFDVIKPSTICRSLRFTKRSGSKFPERSSSYSKKRPSRFKPSKSFPLQRRTLLMPPRLSGSCRGKCAL